MQNFHLLIYKLSLLVLLLLPMMTLAQKGNKIAYIQETEILKSIEDYKVQIKELDSLKQSFTNDLSKKTETLKEKLQTLLDNYELQEGETLESVQEKLKEEDKEKYSLYMEENNLLKDYSSNYEKILQTKYKQNIQPILDRVNSVIKEYAKSKNINIIHKLEELNVAYIDEDLNITDAILKKLEEK